jgi:hypothetical protein
MSGRAQTASRLSGRLGTGVERLRERLEAGLTWLRAQRIPTWLLGGLLALVSWRLVMDPPAPGIDLSWNAGLAMAANEQLHFGTEVVFTYGPLGFLRGQWVWFEDLAVIAFCYSVALYLAFCISVIWALRRAFPTAVALGLGFFAVILLAGLEQPVLLPAIVGLGMLERERSTFATNLLVVGGASFAAVELLIKLSTGPLIAGIVLVTLLGLRARWWQLLGFVALLAVEVVLLWLLAGQAASNVPEYLANWWEVASGYNRAMGVDTYASSLARFAAMAAAVVVLVALVAASAVPHYIDGRARASAILLTAAAGFLMFKEGVVRADANHLVQYLSSACLLWFAIPWSRAQRPALVAGAAVIAALSLHVRPDSLPPPEIDVIGNVSKAQKQVRNLLSPSRRADLEATGREWMTGVYDLDPGTLAALRGRSVAVDPYEIGVVWAYGLDWSPLPVFQNYSAYTQRLDRLNAETVASPSGPERILRENPPLVYPEFTTPGLDSRFPGWDPPAQSRAVLCHFAPLHTTARWQVLARVGDRCGRPRLVREVETSFGEPVAVPAPGRREVVFARIHGVEVDGLEQIRALLWRANFRYAVVNNAEVYRLVPDTAAEGLMLRASGNLAGSGPFAQTPQAKTIHLAGIHGDLTFEFFRMRIRKTPVQAASSRAIASRASSGSSTTRSPAPRRISRTR